MFIHPSHQDTGTGKWDISLSFEIMKNRNKGRVNVVNKSECKNAFFY